jgi:4'-phosphopantetheinyl transferase
LEAEPELARARSWHTDERVVMSAPGDNLTISVGEVHIWIAHLPDDRGLLARFWETLSEAERTVVRRLRLERDQNARTASRGILRDLLSRYRGVSPRELEFGENSYGKPYLRAEKNSDLRFNLSHSHQLAIYAFTEGSEIGVDIEHIRDVPDGLNIARRFFSPPERHYLSGFEAHHLSRAFFTCWTRKEAYIKARGMGLGIPLNTFDVSGCPGLVRSHDNPEQNWTVVDLEVPAEYAGALALEHQNFELVNRTWPDGPPQTRGFRAARP